MFLIGAIKPIIEKKIKTCFIFYATIYAVGFLAATKTLHERKEK